MDMQHIIIELLSGFAERIVFTGLLTALTPLEENRVLDGTPTMWYTSA